MRFSLDRRSHALREPLIASHGTVASRETLILSVTDGRTTGLGEAAPLPSYDSGDLSSCSRALSALVGTEIDLDPDDPAAETARLGGDFPAQARSALDCALHDLAARRAGMPLWSYLGATENRPIDGSWLITASTADAAALEAADAIRRGFSTLKAKAGLDDDLDRIAAIRSVAPPPIALRLDANGCWSADEADERLSALSQFDVELCEQPVRGLAQISRLHAESEVRLALDEDATIDGAFRETAPAIAICLKLGAWGGVSSMVSAAERARATGHEVYLGSTLDGPIGIAASIHAAVAIAPDLASGLATLASFEDIPSDLLIDGGRLVAGDRPGIGLDPDGREL